MTFAKRIIDELPHGRRSSFEEKLKAVGPLIRALKNGPRSSLAWRERILARAMGVPVVDLRERLKDIP